MRVKAPGPSLPFGVRRFRRDAATILLELQQKYGDVTRFRVGPELLHQVAAPEIIRDVLHDSESYRRGRVYLGFELFFGKGSLTTDGHAWRTLRSTAGPFFRTGFLHPNVPVITDAVTDLAREWEVLANKGEPVDIVPEMMRLAYNVVTRVLFGYDLRHRGDEVLPAIVNVLSGMFPGSPELLLPSWLPGPHRRRLRGTQRVLDDAVGEVIDHGGDRLVAALHETSDVDTQEPLTRRQIMDELKNHLLAGHETTGCGLAWTLHELARHPDVHERLRAELDTVLGDRDPEAEDLTRLTYLGQVVNESMRLHPPIPMFPRDPIHDIEIGGYHIPAGTTMFVTPYTVHHDPRHWPEPERFDPDRFAPDAPRPARYTYLPFGGGQRRCVGAPLAELEIRLAVAMIARRFRLTPLPGHRVEPHSLISLRPRFGLVMRIDSALGVR
jgi:cytochrome P450